jgi:hypothetical protein
MSKSDISVESKGWRVLVLSEIRTDAGCQPRSGISDYVVSEYHAHLSRGGDLPPVAVFYDGSEYYLADGYHRFHAHDRAGLKRINAVISQGTLREAVLYSLGANQTHGLRRSNEDKRRAVERMFGDDEWRNWSDAKIAEHIGVSQTFVRDLRPKIAPTSHKLSSDESERRLGRDGKMRSASRKLKASGVTRTSEHSQSEPEYEEPARQVEESAGVLLPRVAVPAKDSSDRQSPAPADALSPHDAPEGRDRDVTESPDPRIAVSDRAPADDVGVDAAGSAPLDDREGGDSVVTHPERAAVADPNARPTDGMVPYWVDLNDPVSFFANGLAMAMKASRVLQPETFARYWPKNMPLRSEELNEFCNWLSEFRARYKRGNDAALRAAE